MVVGQPKKKKRKRAAEKEKADAAADRRSPKQEEDMEVEAFDYASVSNILDDGSDHEADVPSAKKKQKHSKGASELFGVRTGNADVLGLGSNAAFYGNFPAPPKAHSQLKSGNQSRTFR